ncbi:hypothetical protein EAF04_007046 [Stromatinia cepivora]|nr:hypothetical protein EAF04_007046 [Stromatinia cepivora]
MIVLPSKHVDEFSVLPTSVANPTKAHIHNLLGSYTGLSFLRTNNLHHRTVQTKLTPNLNAVTKPIEDELVAYISSEMPNCENKWLPFNPYKELLMRGARMSGGVFLGLPYCRSPQWLEISTEFTENSELKLIICGTSELTYKAFVTIVTMRSFPTWLHPLLGPILPSVWRGKSHIRRGKVFLAPIFKELLRKSSGGMVKERSEEESVMSRMVETASTSERDPKLMAHLEMVLSLASIHSTQMNAVHVLFDLAAHPEYFDELRKEIHDVYEEDSGWKKSSYSKLRKMDSLLRECQRFSPPECSVDASYHGRVLHPE